MTTPTHPPVYCPICGATLDIAAQRFPHRPDPLWLLTCVNPRCAVYQRTADEATLADAATLARWRVQQAFDVRSGREVVA